MDNKARLQQEAMEFYRTQYFPPHIPLNMRVIWKRTFRDYEEWKIEYDVETADTMSTEAGHRVPAYLLIPRGDYQRPLPAVVCFHQCALNCVIGKEAVVGKTPWSYEASDLEPGRPQGRIAPARIDQAYGHDLVHQGFVVLAPDSINCGERNIEAIRKAGENRGCFKFIDEQLGRPLRDKHMFDNMRAVDLLQSLDFVDPLRIGAIGHSMGAGDVFELMIVDKRVKAGILSGEGPTGDAKFLPLVSPRLYIGIRGESDGPPDYLRKVREMHANARPFYAADGAPENLVLLTAKMGHWFGDKLKWRAYKRLKEFFGVLPQRKVVDLSEILTEAREASRWMAEEEQGGTFPEPRTQANCFVLVNPKEIVSALAGLFLYVSDQVAQVELRISIEEDKDHYIIQCYVLPNRDTSDDFAGASYQTLREVERILAEHDTALQMTHSGHGIRYQIAFPKANLK